MLDGRGCCSIAGDDELAVLIVTGDGEASHGERVGAVWVEIGVHFLAASFSFIGSYGVIDPDVDALGGRVDNSVPYLCDASSVPWDEGCVECALTGGAISSSEEVAPCVPYVGGGFCLSWESVCWRSWVVVSV